MDHAGFGGGGMMAHPGMMMGGGGMMRRGGGGGGEGGERDQFQQILKGLIDIKEQKKVSMISPSVFEPTMFRPQAPVEKGPSNNKQGGGDSRVGQN